VTNTDPNYEDRDDSRPNLRNGREVTYETFSRAGHRAETIERLVARRINEACRAPSEEN